ncbi:hypothetical protein [Sphingomonas sanxanigenens]|uniref:Uncharacterized protein n=1 Tax=Sphingomonas sanxanigenens DSM 19645 = NX02 TaxID=1123269 RepID=W0AND6_9SPHN|nr:hypothetical protein [Sphingomonas sanxanigenens]AHE57220.1 hypothetical protein NX02_28190 [Sphingomonas sanxanigenens DSM 19645 = NX02]
MPAVLPALIATLALLAAGAPAPPLSATAAKQVRCVAALAIVATEQQRGAEGWRDYPRLAEDGATYAERVVAEVAEQSGRAPAAVQQAIVDAVAAIQAEAGDSADPDAFARAEADRCLPLMRAKVPAREQPTLPQCAAYIRLAYDEIRAREGATPAAKDLATIASVLDHRAREMLRGQGRSDLAIDEAMGREKERVTAAAAAGAADRVDLPHCFDLAAP